MVDLNTCPPTPPAGERSKIKSFMGRTPGIGILKSKFMTVLGNSNELLNGISSKLTLNISSSDSDYCDDDEEDLPKFDETIDYTKIDFESRRVKARRAHEEIISGRYRHPNLAPRVTLEATRPATALGKSRRSSSSSSTSSSNSSSLSSHSLAATNILERRSHISSTTRSNSSESRHSGGYGRPGRAIAGARRSELDMKKDLLKINDLLNPNMNLNPQIDVQPPNGIHEHTTPDIWTGSMGAGGATTSANSMRVPVRSRTSNSSTLTSLRDDPDVPISPSAESTEELHVKNFIRSESQNSVPSWASSISLDCRIGEEPVKEFMKRFTEHIFTNAAIIGLELKSEFGAMARLEIGRQWFGRFLLEQKTKSKRLDELAFHSLVQYFAIVLFECGEYEDFTPGAVIMNLCFVFYYDIEVPGCDPYRQYLFTFMRQQPIWHTLRFWNAAFFDAIQKERDHRSATRLRRAEKRKRNRKERHAVRKSEAIESNPDTPCIKENINEERAEGEHDASSSSSSHHGNALVRSSKGSKKGCLSTTDREELEREIRLLENNEIVFRQMGAFTCNMHSLGIPQDLCLEFLKKQTASFNLPKDKTKLIKDNIYRMYHETDLWGAKES